jgi:hypothetical protein
VGGVFASKDIYVSATKRTKVASKVLHIAIEPASTNASSSPTARPARATSASYIKACRSVSIAYNTRSAS